MNSAGTVTEGTLTTAAPGIDTAVTICGGLICGGAEEEDCETFRKRYLERLSYQPRATMTWLKQKILEFPCATRSVPCWQLLPLAEALNVLTVAVRTAEPEWIHVSR